MAGAKLHAMDLDLCDYVLGQIRPFLRQLPERLWPPIEALDYDRFNRLTLPVWLGRGVAQLPKLLADHLWAQATGEPVALLLNEAELDALAHVVDDSPLRCEEDCVWEPFRALHRQYVESVPEIQAALTKSTAEEWARESLGFASRLEAKGLPLLDGIETVHAWLICIRRLLNTMGALNYLPAPVGYHPTPTIPKPVASPPGDLAKDPDRFLEAVAALRKAITELPGGETAKAGIVIQHAGLSNQFGRKVLRWLEERGEYRGYDRTTPARYRPRG